MMHQKEVGREEIEKLTSFFSAIRQDHRISKSHLTLYIALFQLYNLNQFENPVKITRKAVMEAAKIKGIATFHKCIKDLTRFGYIGYEPSYNPGISSQIRVLRKADMDAQRNN